MLGHGDASAAEALVGDVAEGCGKCGQIALKAGPLEGLAIMAAQ